MNKNRVYFYLQKLKNRVDKQYRVDKSHKSYKPESNKSFKNIFYDNFLEYPNKPWYSSPNFPIFNRDFPVLLLDSGNKKILIPDRFRINQTESTVVPRLASKLNTVLCSECKFYKNRREETNNFYFYIYDNIGICTFKRNQFLSDETVASVNRLDKTACGEKGRWFERKSS